MLDVSWHHSFEESQATRRLELSTNTTEKEIFSVNIKLTDLIGFADQEKVTCGLGCTLTLKRNNHNDPIIRTAVVDAAKIDMKNIDWYIPHFTPSSENQQIIMDQLMNKDPTACNG